MEIEEQTTTSSRQAQISKSQSNSVCCSGLGSKIVTVSVLMIIQGALIVGKFEDNLTASWGVIFIPIWILLLLLAIYGAVHFFDQSTNKDRYLSKFWKTVLWVVLVIFFIILAVELDTGDVDGSTLVIIWIAYFAFLLLFTLVIGCIRYCGGTSI